MTSNYHGGQAWNTQTIIPDNGFEDDLYSDHSDEEEDSLIQVRGNLPIRQNMIISAINRVGIRCGRNFGRVIVERGKMVQLRFRLNDRYIYQQMDKADLDGGDLTGYGPSSLPKCKHRASTTHW